MPRITYLLFALLLLPLLITTPASAQVIAKVTGINENATVSRSGARQALRRNAGLQVGDIITTDATGSVQIAFVDRTRMVVGPASQLEVEDITLSSAKKASKFTVKALGGTYRFLSGNSPKQAYSLKTPTATMGIRGTEFDFSVDRRRLTNLVTFSGEVRVCNRINRCIRVSGGCAVVQIRRARVQQPETEDEKKELLRNNFPYVVSQQQLANEFRVQTGPCGEVGDVATTTTTTTVAPPTRAVQNRRDGVDGGNADDGGYSEAADEN